MNGLVKSKERVKKFAEVYTPTWLVKRMCEECEPNISDINESVFEPTCGNGNFLKEILARKLNKVALTMKDPKDRDVLALKALSKIYACEIQEDNVQESRRLMLDMVLEFCDGKCKYLDAAKSIIEKNIVHGDTLKHIHLDGEPIYFIEWSITKDNGILEIKETPHKFADMVGEAE